MMSKRFISLSLLIATAGALSFAAACSSSSSGSSGTPTPTPTQYTDCVIIWESNGSKAHPGNTNFSDVGEVVAPIAAWVNGTGAYNNTDTFSAFFTDVDFTANTQAVAAAATTGAFSLTLGSTAPATGHSVTYTDTDNTKKYFDASGATLGAQVASNGNASFTGVTSPMPLSGATATLGSGDFTIKVLGSSFSSGSTGGGVTVAGCEDANGNGFAPSTVRDLMLKAHQIIVERNAH